MANRTRREFLGTGAAGLGLFFFGGALQARPSRRGLGGMAGSERILVLLQLSGGNDGLSMIVPHGDDAYGRARTATRVPLEAVLKIDQHVGFHPELGALQKLYGDGRLAIVQGAGYPSPTRSHFKSLDVWHAADTRGRLAGHGWIGRLADTTWTDVQDPTLVCHIGNRIPFSLAAAVHRPVAFTVPEAYRWVGADPEVAALREAAPICEKETEPALPESEGKHLGRDRALSRLRSLLQEAHDSSQAVRDAAAAFKPRAKWPGNRLATSLATVCALATGGIGTRVYSVETGGFDTHNGQRARHDRLMNELGTAIGAFWEEMEVRGLADRVTLVAFSEFGRRVKENGSQGTDHGTAAPVLVLGGGVQGGLFGTHPSLTDLDGNGDLVHTVDFRRVYAAVIDDWFGGRHQEVLGATYERLPLFG